MAKRQSVGIRGRSTMSKSLGVMDPRVRRNPQVTTRGEDYESPLKVARNTRRLGIDRDEARDLILLSPMEAAAGQKFITSIGLVGINVITLDATTLSEGTIHLSDVGTDSTHNDYNLPRASASLGFRYRIKMITRGANSSTLITPFGSELIDRAGVASIPVIMGLNQTVQIVCDGVEWWLI